MKVVDFLLRLVGLENNDTLFTILYACLVFLLSLGVGYVVTWIVVRIVRNVGKHWHSAVYSYLAQEDFFIKAARIIPAIVFLIFVQFTLNGKATLSSWLTRLTWVYILFIVANSVCKIADVTWLRINERANKRKLPLNGIAQLVKGVVWIVCVIIAVAILCEKSPASLLAGLGAFAAVLMLVFKDSISWRCGRSAAVGKRFVARWRLDKSRRRQWHRYGSVIDSSENSELG